MEIEFGWNCRCFVPTLQKCRVLIENYSARKDLLEQRWLSTPELLVYLSATQDEILTRILAGEIAAKRQKDGKLLFGISAPWSYDDCYLRGSGGVCLYYKPHAGPKIAFVEQIKQMNVEHPNATAAPTSADVARFEAEVSASGALTQSELPI